MQQRLMLVLTVNVDQHLPQGLQIGQGDRRSVDIRLRSTIAIHHPAQYAGGRIGLELQIIVVQPLTGGDNITGIEFGTDIGLVRAAADNGLIRPVTQGETQCAKHDRFARPGFSGNNRHPGFEFNFQAIDSGVILDGKQLQHSHKVYWISMDKCTFIEFK